MPPTETYSEFLKLEKKPNYKLMKQKGCLNFGMLPDQIVAKAVEKGFVFNVMCIGETGIGKTTLMECLYGTDFETTKTDHFEHGSHLELRTKVYHLVENSISLKLTITETLGYGDQIVKCETYSSLLKYIHDQFEAYMQEELKIDRSIHKYHDTRVHLVLFFLCPTGHGLKSLDLLVMKELCSKVNILPIIAKADTVTKAELSKFRKNIMEELTANNVKIYKFPPTDEELARNSSNAANAIIPFAIIGSKDFVKIGNRAVRCRIYPWGIVEVENEKHCDFMKLRDVMIRTNMEDMKEVTHSNYYETYRAMRLEQMGLADDLDANNEPIPFHECLKAKCNDHEIKLRQMEDDMRESFLLRIKKKEAELKEIEEEMRARNEKMNLEQNAKELELKERGKKLEEDVEELNKKKAQMSISSTLTLTVGKRKKK